MYLTAMRTFQETRNRHFLNVYNKFVSKQNYTKLNKVMEKNMYYGTMLLENLLNYFLPVIPLWSDLMSVRKTQSTDALKSCMF